MTAHRSSILIHGISKDPLDLLGLLDQSGRRALLALPVPRVPRGLLGRPVQLAHRGLPVQTVRLDLLDQQG